MAKFPKFLIKRRKELLFTQAEVSRRLGFKHSQQLANIESGKAPFPLKRMRRLAKILGTKINHIFDLYISDVEDSTWKEINKS